MDDAPGHGRERHSDAPHLNFDADAITRLLEAARKLSTPYQQLLSLASCHRGLVSAWATYAANFSRTVSALLQERASIRQQAESEFSAEFEAIDHQYARARGLSGFPVGSVIVAAIITFVGAGLVFGWDWGLYGGLWAGGAISLLVYFGRARSMVGYWSARAKVERSVDDRFKEIAERFDERFGELGGDWANARSRGAAVLAQVDAALKALKASDAALLGRLDETGAPSYDGGDRFHFRVGELNDAPSLAGLEANCATAIGADATGPGRLSTRVPAHWTPAEGRALLYVDQKPATEGAGALMTALMARILVLAPPGKVNFTLFDPVGLGHNFSSFLKLSDAEFSKDLIGGKAWSEREHMRARLKDLITHIETVTQKYLRDDFPNIDAYNTKAGEIAEAYKFLVVADYFDRFDEEMARDLDRIIQNGPRCGVFCILHVNGSVKPPYGVNVATLRPFSVEVRVAGAKGEQSQFVAIPEGAGAPLAADGPPRADVLTRIVEDHGKGSLEAARVEVAYSRLLSMAGIDANAGWQRSSVDFVEAPLGPMGAKKVQTLKLGAGLSHHGLIVGRPGSGKSNLLHVFITSIARLYSPDEVQFYLVDFKKGVEFKAYAQAKLPHARVIAVESEREFGLSVLSGLDEELKARGEKFRRTGAVSLPEYRAKTGEVMARIILLVDEFQEFFNRDDRIHQEARAFIDRLVRQGRAFGIHLILGTQSLANSGLPVSTRDQMAVRIALQCSEADSRLILADDNTAARLLSRPGEAIFNDSAGQVEGNNLFQAALFSEEDRVRELASIAALAREKGWRGEPIVFEGHEPADILTSPALRSDAIQPIAARLDMWLGEPIALRGPVAAMLKRQSGRNLVAVTKEEEQGLGIILSCLSALARQRSASDLAFHILDFSSADAAWADYPEAFAASIPHQAKVFGRRDVGPVLKLLADEVASRTDSEARKSGTTHILAIIGLHRVRDLRADSGAGLSFDAAPDTPLVELLDQILRNGPEVGVHTLMWCDAFASLERAIDRRGVNEIGLRISGPMSGQDSHRFFDDDVAANIEKPHRMILFDEDKVGVFEQFRPYAANSAEFADILKQRLSRN